MSTKRSAFTLVELLVVIGIIVLLIAILLPSLRRARESGLRVQCQSNLRQLVHATLMYASENKGFIPPGNVSSLYVPNDPKAASSWPARLQPYLKSKSAYTCPSTRLDVPSFSSYLANGQTWLFWDDRLTGLAMFGGPGGLGHLAGPTKLNQIRHSSKVVLFTETSRDVVSQTMLEGNSLRADQQMGMMFYTGLSYTDLSGGRHFLKSAANGLTWGEANFAFVDGSCRSASMKDLVQLNSQRWFFQHPIDPVNAAPMVGNIVVLQATPSKGKAADFWFVPWW